VMSPVLHSTLITLLLTCAAACTTVIVPTPEGPVIGRTMELGIPHVSSELEHIYFHPRGTKVQTMQGTLPDAKYGYLAVQFALSDNVTLSIGTTDGMNEAGLTVSLQTHRAAVYESPNSSKLVAIGDLSVASYLLGCCATVVEAVEALSRVNVRPTPIVGTMPIGSVHFSLQDPSGASRAVEFIDGVLRVYDNTEVGVFTNDPSFEWHLGNLDQYAAYPASAKAEPFPFPATARGHFTHYAVDAKGGAATVPAYSGHGLHSKFLPGGFSPADRFVRMFLLKQLATAHKPPHSAEDGIVLATGLLNNVHIPYGAVMGDGGFFEDTNWACLKVPKAAGANRGPTFYYRTYDNMQYKKVDLGRIDFSGSTAYAPIPLYEPGLGVRDATPAGTQ